LSISFFEVTTRLAVVLVIWGWFEWLGEFVLSLVGLVETSKGLWSVDFIPSWVWLNLTSISSVYIAILVLLIGWVWLVMLQTVDSCETGRFNGSAFSKVVSLMFWQCAGYSLVCTKFILMLEFMLYTPRISVWRVGRVVGRASIRLEWGGGVPP